MRIIERLHHPEEGGIEQDVSKWILELFESAVNAGRMGPVLEGSNEMTYSYTGTVTSRIVLSTKWIGDIRIMKIVRPRTLLTDCYVLETNPENPTSVLRLRKGGKLCTPEVSSDIIIDQNDDVHYISLPYQSATPEQIQDAFLLLGTQVQRNP